MILDGIDIGEGRFIVAMMRCAGCGRVVDLQVGRGKKYCVSGRCGRCGGYVTWWRDKEFDGDKRGCIFVVDDVEVEG